MSSPPPKHVTLTPQLHRKGTLYIQSSGVMLKPRTVHGSMAFISSAYLTYDLFFVAS